VKEEVIQYKNISNINTQRKSSYKDKLITILFGSLCFILGTKYEKVLNWYGKYQETREKERINRLSKNLLERLKEDELFQEGYLRKLTE
jgi:hypothetical protein